MAQAARQSTLPEAPGENGPSLPGRLLRIISWLGPALLLAASGTAKLISPDGEIPVLLQGRIAPSFYPTLLRLLGLVEISLAALLVPRATRRLGRPLATLLLLLFVALVALSFGDPEFLSRCGCFGPLSEVAPGSPLASPYWLLARNLAVVWLLAVGWGSDRRPTASLAPGVRRAALLAVLVALAATAAGEWQAHHRSSELLAAMEVGRPRARALGWVFPDLPLQDIHGRTLSTHEALTGGETILIFSPECPECRREAPSWPTLAAAVRETGRRLVLLGAGPLAQVIDFLDETGAATVEHYALRHPEDAFRAGAFDVPHRLELDGAWRVIRQTGAHQAGGLALSISRTLARDPEAARALFDGPARLLFGGSARCEPPAVLGPGIVVGTVRAGEQVAGKLAIVATGPALPVHAEIIVGIGPWGSIRGLRALRWETGSPEIGLPAPRLATLTGLKLGEARQRAHDEAGIAGAEATDWRTLAHLLGRLIDTMH